VAQTDLLGALDKKLKREGYCVRCVDIKHHEFAQTQADEFLLLDLREEQNCKAALTLTNDNSMKFTNWLPIWEAWDSSLPQRVKLCETAL
jgi:hypothetical protein